MSDGARVPPHSPEAELAVLGAVMLEPGALAAVLPSLQSECFYRADHQKLYAAYVALFSEDMPIDVVSVREQLGRVGENDLADNADLFVTLSGAVPSIANAEYYARVVREKWALRSLITACTETLVTAYDGNVLALDEAPVKMMQVANESRWQEPVDAAELIVEMVEAADKGEELGEPLATGIGKVDVITHGGFRAGELIIIGGRPGSGKSAIAKNMFAYGVGAKRRMAFFSLEEPRKQFLSGVLAHVARADTQDWVDSKENNPAEWQRILKAAERLSCAALQNCLVDDTPGLSPTVLHAKLEQFVARGAVDLVFVDYLQLTSSDPGLERDSTIKRIETATRQMKLLARKFNTRIIALSQLSRESAKQNRPPRLDDLRDCGSIEQDADIVLLMHDTPADKDPSSNEDCYRHNIIVAKQRNGPTGCLKMNFIKPCLTFESVGPEEKPIPEPEPEPEQFVSPVRFEEEDESLPF